MPAVGSIPTIDASPPLFLVSSSNKGELGILEIVTHNQTIRFYSLADGSVVPSASASSQYTYGKEGSICRVIFEDFEYPIHQQQTPRLLYAQGAVVRELAW